MKKESKKHCRQCDIVYIATKKELDFLEKISPVFNGKKYNIGPQSTCPKCSLQNKYSFRNEMNLYKRTCSQTNKNIISIYSPDKNNIVFDQDYWWTDNWSELDFGQEIYFDKIFFGQLNRLHDNIPKRALIKGTGSENSDYVNGVGASKNSYLIFDSTNIEDCYYGNRYAFCNNCIDCTSIFDSENCYELIDAKNCDKCNKLINSVYSQNSNKIIYCQDCYNKDVY